MADRWAVLRALVTTRWRRFGTREHLRRYQQRRLSRVLSRARAVFPFYAGVPLTGSPEADLAAFPVLDKDIWLAHFAELNDRGLSLADCLDAARAAEASRRFDARVDALSVGLSSGTSGRQGVFLTSDAERARWAGTVLARALPSLREPARVALVLRSGGPLYEAVEGGRVSFRYIDLALDPDAVAAQVAEFAPTILAAPPQVLDDLAARRSGGRLPNTVSTVYSVADVLDDDVAARVGAAFGVPVGQVYQATEGFLGITCREGTLHLNEDLLHVERDVIDEASGRFVPIITDLYRTSQAIIRYRLGDVLLPGPDACPCGSVFATVARIEGRADDVLRFTGTDGAEHPLFADFVRGAVLGAHGVQDFRLVQRADGSLRLAVRPQLAQSLAHRALQGLLQSRTLVVPDITGMPWPREAVTAKRRRVRREA
ncbi:F390 synthetase-related protein [Micropruina sonneratiae]|uniref:F390 synthetase-related protein n=1 Tax=Micropruina sonneratiae TaxID=2986940 RepID=UPI002226C0F2|nr:F390 synthetase-related protein [Micropruina sp. KQZ13P-5]MCW3156722.1 AMP-binding protein [Micropruina sp. KQZ13P-5]